MIILVKTVRAPKHADQISIKLPSLLRLGGGMAIFISYYLLLEPLGIIISSALAIVSCSLMYGERRYKYLLPLAILLPIGLYLFFFKVASIPMPQGILAGIGPF